jgi:lipopolysaccharide transport system ATP-binding protein
VVGAYLSSGLGTTAQRTWPNLAQSPGDEIVRLCAVRVCAEGKVSDAIDIQKPMSIEVEYEVLTPGHVLVPNLHFYNDQGIYAFVVTDLDPTWRGRPRPAGRYVSTALIPGNLLSEGTLFVGAAVSTFNPQVIHFYERDAVAFQVIDSINGNSARGDYAGHMPGVVRPMLQWTTTTISSPIRTPPISHNSINMRS